MPTQLPLESTDLFGDLLFPHTFDILRSDATKPLENHNFSFPVYSVRLNFDFDFYHRTKKSLFNFVFLLCTERVLWQATVN